MKSVVLLPTALLATATIFASFGAHGLVLTSRAGTRSQVGAKLVTAATPTEQVLTMMQELKKKGEAMMETEKKTFATYAEWADDESKKLGFEIQDGQSKIEELTAFITKAESDAAELGREVDALDAEIDQLTTQKKEAAEVRASQHKENVALIRDYSESVDALKRAIQVVSAQNYDREQAEALLQRIPAKAPELESILAALQSRDGPSPAPAPAPAAAAGQLESAEPSGLAPTADVESYDPQPAVDGYKFQSGGILELLESLLDKFSKELAEAQEAESNQAHEFGLVELHLRNTIAKDTSDRHEKAQLRASKKAASAKAQGELSETKAAKADDEALKSEIETTFTTKKITFQENQKVRAAEIDAIAKAIDIISSSSVSEKYSQHINLLQLKRSTSGRAAIKESALSLLRSRGTALQSQALTSLAASLASAGPLDKVIGMIEGLLAKLKEDAAAEADHKGWCDEQLKANKLKRDKKTTKVEELSASVESLNAVIQEQASTIAKLADEQAALTKAMSEATAIRTKEKEENAVAIEDAKAGSAAVKQAIVLLKEFYASQEATESSFLQTEEVPEMAAYKGMQGSKGGVIGMLEVIESDFLRLRAETEASEKAAAAEYKTFMEKSEASKKQKHEAEYKLKLSKDKSEFEKEETVKDLRSTEEELSKANDYYEHLKPSCLVVHVSFEERAAKRQEEIAALKEAYSILDQKGQ